MTKSFARFAGVIVAALALFGAPTVARAHPAYITVGEITIDPDGHWRMMLQFDTLAFALNDTSARIGNEPMDALMAGPREKLEAQLAGAKARFQHGFGVVTDHGAGFVEIVGFPDAAAVLAWRATKTPVLPVVLPVQVKGELPAGTGTVAFRFPSVLDQVIITVERPGEEPDAEAVEAGTSSTVLPVKLSAATR